MKELEGMHKIPKCMSTQHPDNVTPPFFAANAELEGEDEVQEAYYAFSHLGCDEQMWDCEGKEVDNFIIRKLLTKYEPFFKEKKIGKDVFITLRAPNPAVERAEAKILLETLESIPRSFDAATLFYSNGISPIFEIILPMTTSSKCLNRVYRYYCDFIIGKHNKPLAPGDITVAEWVGEFKPERINVIPLFEDMEHLLDAHNITREYLHDKETQHQRVFLARSDPAMNYGLIAAVLLNKIALQRLQQVSETLGIEIYPILGTGSAPFRGNLRPPTVERVMKEYPSVHTFTIQSAFKYDYPPEDVREGIRTLQMGKKGSPHQVDEQKCLEIIKKSSDAYRRQITALAPIIAEVAQYVPSRRKRKLHIGLFGYARGMGGITLPRAIPFTAALYSIGLPPEVLGVDTLNRDDLHYVKQVYVHFEDDLRDALRYLNHNSLVLLNNESAKSIAKFESTIASETDEEHKHVTDFIIDLVRKGCEAGQLKENILRAANLRRFLG